MATRNTSSRSTSAFTSRGASGAKNKIIAMLKADHKNVKKAFKDFQKLDPHEDPERCQQLVEQTLAQIEVHAELEEQLFYPAARGAIKEEELIDEAEVEHMTAKVLIEQMKGMGPGDEKYAATFKVLGEYINHHVQEEEGEIFKQLTQAGAEWDAVFEDMQAQRGQLMEEKGMSAEADETQAPAGMTRPSTGGRGATRSAEARPQAAGKASKTSPTEKK